mgnify:CR=1 FL=1
MNENAPYIDLDLEQPEEFDLDILAKFDLEFQIILSNQYDESSGEIKKKCIARMYEGPNFIGEAYPTDDGLQTPPPDGQIRDMMELFKIKLTLEYCGKENCYSKTHDTCHRYWLRAEFPNGKKYSKSVSVDKLKSVRWYGFKPH